MYLLRFLLTKEYTHYHDRMFNIIRGERDKVGFWLRMGYLSTYYSCTRSVSTLISTGRWLFLIEWCFGSIKKWMLPFKTVCPFHPEVPYVGIDCVILEARLLCSIYIALCSVVRMRFVIHFKFIVYVYYIPTPSHIEDEHIYSVFIKSFLSLGIITYFQRRSKVGKHLVQTLYFPISVSESSHKNHQTGASSKIVTIQCEVKIKV